MSDSIRNVRLEEIPIVGQVATVFAGDVQAVMVCKCDPKNEPFLISSVHSLVLCENCRGVYKIMGAHFDVRSGKPVTVAVAQVGKAEVKE